MKLSGLGAGVSSYCWPKYKGFVKSAAQRLFPRGKLGSGSKKPYHKDKDSLEWSQTEDGTGFYLSAPLFLVKNKSNKGHWTQHRIINRGDAWIYFWICRFWALISLSGEGQPWRVAKPPSLPHPGGVPPPPAHPLFIPSAVPTIISGSRPHPVASTPALVAQLLLSWGLLHHPPQSNGSRCFPSNPPQRR